MSFSKLKFRRICIVAVYRSVRLYDDDDDDDNDDDDDESNGTMTIGIVDVDIDGRNSIASTLQVGDPRRKDSIERDGRLQPSG